MATINQLGFDAHLLHQCNRFSWAKSTMHEGRLPPTTGEWVEGADCPWIELSVSFQSDKSILTLLSLLCDLTPRLVHSASSSLCFPGSTHRQAMLAF